MDRIVVGDFYDDIKGFPVYAGVRDLEIKSQTEGLNLSLSHALPYVNTLYRAAGDTYYFSELYISASPGMYDGVVSAVRSRLVDLLLEMEDIFDDDEDVKWASDSQRQEVDQIFTQIINIRHASNFAVGNYNCIEDLSQNVEVAIEPGSIEDLSAYFKQIGLADSDIGEIDDLLEQVYEGNLNTEQKASVSRWVREKAKKIGGEFAMQMIITGLVSYAPAAMEFLNSIPVT